MKSIPYVNVIFTLLLVAKVPGVKGRYECIMTVPGGGLGEADDLGEMDEFEPGEMDEMDEGMEGAAAAQALFSGTISCSSTDRERILIKRVAYGVGFARCESFSYCQEEFEVGGRVSDRCDGLSTCYVNFVTPRFLKCGQTSNYLMVEYECLDAWSTFEVCERESTVVRNPSVFILSPGYLSFQAPSRPQRGTQVCECIFQSRDKDDLYMDFLQTDLSDERDTCPYDYVTIDTKEDINQTTVNKEMEVCGRRHVGGKWFKGSIRITYASGGPMQRRGLAAKFTVDNKGYAPQIEIECGPVDAKHLKLKERPPSSSRPTSRDRTPPWAFPPLPPFAPVGNRSLNMRETFGVANTMMGLGRDDGSAMFGMMPLPPFLPLNPPAPPPQPKARPKADKLPDFSTWKIKVDKTPAAAAAAKGSSAPRNPQTRSKPTVPSRSTFINPPRRSQGARPNRNQPSRPGSDWNRNKAQQVDPGQQPAKAINEQDVEEKSTDTVSKSNKGSFAGLVFGGIGAALILGSVTILVVYNYRKRQRIKKEEAQYYSSSISSTYGKGWEKEEESVYATVAEVEMHRFGCVNPAVSNTDITVSVESAVNASYNRDRPIPDRPLQPKTTPNRNTEIAVIDVHAPKEEDYSNGTLTLEALKLEEDCKTTCSDYAVVRHANGGSTTLCDGCNLMIPPRKKHSVKRANDDYDNNIGVKKYAK